MSLRWILRLPDSENDLKHSLRGEGELIGKWLLPRKWRVPENGLSWEIQNTSHFNLINLI